MRCDIKPMGYSIVAGGPDASNLTSWKCTNSSLSHCSWSNFWTALPKNASYEGKATIDGRVADKWMYWLDGEQWAHWAKLGPEGDIPVAWGKTLTAVQGYHLFHVLVHDYTPVAPNVSDFSIDPRIHCPSPPLS